MAEYVDKEIVKEAIGMIANACLANPRITRGEIQTFFKGIPTADVRPVVLCKDCELWNEWDSSGRESLGTYRCSCAAWTTETTTFYTGPNEFCSRGERKCSDG